jgi:hypothetical protein
MGKVIDNVAKAVCAFVFVVAMLSAIGIFFGGDDTAPVNVDSPHPTSTSTPTPTATPEPVESSVADNINVIKSRQDIIVECKRLSVFGNNNAIQIANNDVERIMITGSENSISYSSGADPRIDDLGDYNDVWQRWLT